MPILTLKFKDNVLGTYRLDKGQSLTIGRKESNDIAIENLAVSGHHAKIDSVGEGFLLTDLKSKNRTFVNKELISSHWLKADDVVLIGKHTLIFTFEAGEAQPEESGDMEKTMVMDTEMQRDMMAQAKAARGHTQVMADSGVGAMLSYLAGGEGEVELTKKLTKIGKNSSCDIVVSGLMVGQIAATISKRPQGYSLSYVEGMSKPKVNGTAVKESVMLNEFDQIEIGSVKLQFVTK